MPEKNQPSYLTKLIDSFYLAFNYYSSSKMKKVPLRLIHSGYLRLAGRQPIQRPWN